jgi:hypothetical protein
MQDVHSNDSCCCFVNFNTLIFFICICPQELNNPKVRRRDSCCCLAPDQRPSCKGVGIPWPLLSDRNTYCCFCCIVAFAALLLFNLLIDFPSFCACAGGFDMDQDSSPKHRDSLHETHLKRTRNLTPPKWQLQPLQPPQPRRWSRQRPPAAAIVSSNKPS